MRRLGSVAVALSVVLLSAYAAQAVPLAYVTNQTANTVQVLRTSDGFLVATIPVGLAPTGISIPSVGGFAYVANRGSDTVSRIDLATNTVTATIPVPGDPTSVAVLPNGTFAYVVQSTNCALPPPAPTPGPGAPTPTPSPSPVPAEICTVAVIDTASNSVVATIDVGDEPFAVAASPSDAFVYVTNRADDTMTVIDTTTNLPIATVPVGNTPEGVAVGAGQIYVANDASNTVTVIREVDLQPTGTVATGAGPLGVAVSWDGTRGMVSNDPDNTVTIFDTATNLALGSVPVGANPAGIAVLPDSSKAVVANSSSGTVSFVSFLGGVVSHNVFGSPVQVAITPEPSLRIAKVANPNPPQAGQLVAFGLTYANVGSGPATNALIADVVPAHMTFDSATNGGALGAGSPAQVEWTIPAIPVGGSGTVVANFLVTSPIADMTPTTNIARITDPATGIVTQTALAMKIDSDPVYEISVASAPDPVAAGGTLTYTVSFGNIGTSTSVATRMDVEYDPNVTFLSSVPAPTQGDDVWFFDSLPPGGSGTVTITVQVGSPLANGSFLSTDFEMSDAFGNPTTATALTAIQSAPALALSMTDIPDPVPSGGTLLYDIVYSNPGTDTATGVVLTVAYDPNLTFITSDVLPDAGTTNQWTIASVPGGGIGRIMVQVQVPQILPNGSVLASSASIVDGVGNTAAAAADTTVQSQPTLALAKIDGPDPVPSGGQVTYTLTYSNVGGADATGVVVAEAYPLELAFVSSVPAPDAGTDNQWTIGTLAAGTSGVITITMDVIAPNGSIASNVAVVTDSAGNSATATSSTIIDLLPQLTVAIADTPDPVAPGGLLTYTIDYGNTGTDVANGVVLSAALPSNVTLIQANPPPDVGTTSTWTLGTLAIGATGSISIQALVNTPLPNGTLLFSQASIQDVDLQLATASDSTVVTSVSNLALAVNVNPNPVSSGGPLTYQIVYGNPSDVPLAGVLAAQIYDPRVNFVSSIPAPSAASNDIWSLATLSPGEVGTITVNLTVDTGLATGSVLLSEARVEAVTGEVAQAAEVSTVGATPPLDVEVTSAAGVSTSGGAVDFTVSYRNTSGTPLTNVVLTFDPGAFGFVLQSTPEADDPDVPLWEIGTLGAGANGSLSVKVVNGAPAGGILTVSAVGTATGGFTDTDLYHVAAVGGGSTVTVGPARYESRPAGARGPQGQVKLRFATPTLPLTWNGSQGVGVTFSTQTQVLAAFYIPAGRLQELDGRSGPYWKFSGKNPGPGGGNVFFRLRPKGDGIWRLRAGINKYDVPISPSEEIRMTVSLGADALTAERQFKEQKGRTAVGSQRLSYKGDN